MAKESEHYSSFYCHPKQASVSCLCRLGRCMKEAYSFWYKWTTTFLQELQQNMSVKTMQKVAPAKIIIEGMKPFDYTTSPRPPLDNMANALDASRF